MGAPLVLEEHARLQQPDSAKSGAHQSLHQTRGGSTLTGEGGLLTDLMCRVVWLGLDVEMTDHVGYERDAVEVGDPGTRGTAPSGAGEDRRRSIRGRGEAPA